MDGCEAGFVKKQQHPNKQKLCAFMHCQICMPHFLFQFVSISNLIFAASGQSDEMTAG